VLLGSSPGPTNTPQARREAESQVGHPARRY